MKTGRNYYCSSLALITGLAVAMTAGCGKKDKKDDDNDSAKVEVVETQVQDLSIEGGVARIKYKSNISGATFKCATDVNGQAGEWSDCPAEGTSLQLQPNTKYTFRVKAIGPDGREDAEPATYTFNGPEQQGEEPGKQEPALDIAAKILNKAEIGATVSTGTSLTLQLGVSGASVNAQEIRFECLRETEREFRRCTTADTYVFADLIEGSSYALVVRAVHTPTGTISAEDSVTFKVELARLIVNGEAELQQRKDGTINLSFDQAQIRDAKVSCNLDNLGAQDCTYGLPLNLDQLQPGSHALSIDAKDQAGKTVASTVINFCARSCSTQGTSEPIVQSFQIGSFYEYLVPQTMHVTEYATTKTYNNQLSFYRVLQESDPYYLGNYGCYRDFDRKMSAPAPSGKMYDYCHTTPQRDVYKWLTDYRLANNHLEVATNEEEISPYNHDRIMINVFDTDYEYMMDRSRFEQLCMNKRGTITKSPPIRFIDRNFWGENVKAEFYMCVVEIADGGRGFPTAADEWWVGAFFITSDSLNLPRYECFKYDWKVHSTCNGGCFEEDMYPGITPQWCGEFHNPNLLEVVYMTKTPFREPADFARAAQAKFVKNLFEITPVTR